MTAYDNAYSRFIALARIALPLAALGLLSTLFLISRDRGPGQSPSAADIDLGELAREQRLGAPNFATVTGDGTAISLRAETARLDPATPDRAIADRVQARLDMRDGNRAEIEADRGVVDQGTRTLVLEGAVEIRTSTGYRVRSERLVSAIDATDVVSEGPVTGDGPPGRIEAGAMQLREDPAAPDRYLLVFNDGVRLVYEPEE